VGNREGTESAKALRQAVLLPELETMLVHHVASKRYKRVETQAHRTFQATGAGGHGFCSKQGRWGITKGV
jgi:hypothetical protein